MRGAASEAVGSGYNEALRKATAAGDEHAAV